MKKFLAILMAAVMMAGMSLALAEDAGIDASVTLVDQLSSETAEAVEGAAVVMEGVVEVGTDKSGSDRAGSGSDKVTISGNNYTVVTPEGITITYTKPSSNYVFCLTQDYVQQYQVYDMFYSSPLSVAQSFIDEGMHFNVFDAESEIDIYLYVERADWANMFPNTLDMSVSDADALLAAMNEGINVFRTAAQTLYGWVGGNIYFVANASNNGYVHMLTAVKGYSIYIYYKANNTNDVVKGLELLDGLTIK